MEKAIFSRKKVNIERLIRYGFVEKQGNYLYSTHILDGQFLMLVTVSAAEGQVHTKLIDHATGDEYALHRLPQASGAFVGQVKKVCMQVLQDISEKCFEPDVFKSDQAKELIEYVGKQYGDELEFLWQKFPDYAVLRRKDTGKWYAALLTVALRKIGIDSDEMAEIIDLRIEMEKLSDLLDRKKYFPGYHMNKNHWYTICLNDSVETEEICQRIDESFRLAKK